MKLSVRIPLILILISIIATLVVSFLSYYNGKTAIENEVINHITAINNLKESEIENWLAEGKDTIELIAGNTYFKDEYANVIDSHNPLNPEHMAIHQRIIEDILIPGLKSGIFIELFILRMDDGLVMISSDKIQEGKYFSDRPFFINGKNATYIQNVYYSMARQGTAMTIATPIKDREGKNIAVLAGRFDLESLSTIMKEQSGLSKSEDTYLVNNFNFFTTEPRFGNNFTLKKAVYTEGVVKALAYNDGTGFYKDYREIPVIGAYKWNSTLGSAILTEVNQSEAYTPVYNLQKKIIFIGLGVILFSAIVGYLLSLAITKPINKLVEGTVKIGAGDLDYRFNFKSKNEISRLANSFNAMTKKLRETLVSRDKLSEEIKIRKKTEEELKRSNIELESFAYIASHDLQEPLRVISNFSSLLAERYREKIDKNGKEFIDFITDGAIRMQTMIKDLLAFSRVSTRGKPFENTSLKTILDAAKSNLKIIIEETGCNIKIGKMHEITCDRGQFISLFQNLIENAIKFRSEKKPFIEIDVKKDNNNWIISVKDNGIGIQDEYKERIFVIFQKLHTKDEYPGTGIGLSLCKKIVERHNGKIWVESDGSSGSIFYISIPINIKEEHINAN